MPSKTQQVIGITGVIGSGKTTVANVFMHLDIPVFIADEVAKQQMLTHTSLKNSIQNTFGSFSYIHHQLNSSYLANIVFKDKEKLNLLNSMVHPIVHHCFFEWQKKHPTVPYLLYEAAILFECGVPSFINKIIGVTAPFILKIQRLQMRNKNLTKEDIINRMQNQIDDHIKMKLCDWVITNDDKTPILPQVLSIHQSLI